MIVILYFGFTGVSASLSAFNYAMDYVLVGDDCCDCSYVSNALSLLKLSFQKLFIDIFNSEVIANALSTAPDACTIFVCNNIAKNYDKLIPTANLTRKNIISWYHTENNHHEKMPIHFLKMPFSKIDLTNALARCDHCQSNNLILNHSVFKKLVGESNQIQEIKLMIAQVAQSDTTVLILGESGTGKDIIASCIHQLSERKSNSFVPINCGAIPNELMESELFGHEKGAFTGALTRRAGRFEVAHTGTLFLDEIGDMPLSMQVKLLRVLQDQKIERIGGNNTIDVDVRLIAATHKNLETMIAENQFRDDLYYRLNVFPIYVPSLRDRSEDIALIIDYQLDKIYERLKHRVIFTDQAIEKIRAYPWPGNIRELQNFLERMVILYPDQVISETKIKFNSASRASKKKVSKQV